MSNEHQHPSPAATACAEAVAPTVKRGFWSLGRRFAALLSIAMVAGFGPMLWLQARDEQKQTFDLAMAGNATISALLADRAAGGMRWDRKEAIEDAYRGFATAPGSQIAAVRTFDNSGKTTTEFDNKALRDYDLSKALTLDKAMLAAGKTVRRSDDHHVVMVVPVFQGKDKTRVGTFAVAWSTDRLQQNLQDTLLHSVMIAGGVVIALLVLIIVLFKTSVEKPIDSMIRVMGRLVAGNREVEVPGQHRRDDIGAMARMVNTFKENALALDRMAEERERAAAEKAAEDSRLAREKAEEEARRAAERREMEQKANAEKRQALLDLANSFEKRIKSMVDTVSAATTEMRATAQSMTSTAELTNRKSSLVAASSEEATKNVQTVAAAAEELSASVSEISGQVAQSTKITRGAVDRADTANGQIQELAAAARKIDEVLKLISDIAAQTNLLALNATIEAARAGEAGKGFAVVASEVKSLANQTAQATEEIASQISAVQGATGNAVAAIEDITKVIGEISQISTMIASAVEEQGAATQEIARNVEEAAAGTRDVATNIAAVSQGASETGTSAEEVLLAATELSKQSETLTAEVDSYLAQVRAS